MRDEAQESLRRLEEHLDRAAKAAERLMAEPEQTHGTGRPPPAGWQAPHDERGATRAMPELEALLSALGSLRELIPPDAADRLLAALKEVLLAIRALVDHYLERLDRKPPPPAEVEDIPIE